MNHHSTTSATTIVPFFGYVETTGDALRLIQAARCGLIPRVTRRLNELERRAMIRSGAVFIFSVDVLVETLSCGEQGLDSLSVEPD